MTHGPEPYQCELLLRKPCIDDETWVALRSGTVSPAQRAELERHVDACPDCFEVFASLAGQAGQPVEPESRVGRYVLGECLGAGAMGVVYAALDTQLERHVALKLLNPTHETGQHGNARQRLVSEAKAMAQLRHPNVVTVFDGGEVDGKVYVAMERVDGASAQQLMSQEQRSASQWLEWFRQAGCGLAAAHASGIVHRDFKPANVLIGSDGIARVADFGLAKPIAAAGSANVRADASEAAFDPGAAASGPHPTQTGSVVGTPAYLAPEVAAGGPATAASDQYSFCLSLYEVLHGERPRRPLTMARGVPYKVRRVLRRGLSLDPTQRYPSMNSLLEDLAPTTRVWRVLGAVSVAGAVLLLSVVGFLVWYNLRGPPTVLLSGRELAAHHRETLVELKLLEPGDQLHFLYANGAFSLGEDVSLLTDTHVVIHQADVDPPTVWIELDEIDRVIVIGEVGYFDTRFITLRLSNGDEYDIPSPSETAAAERYAGAIRHRAALRRRRIQQKP